MADQFNVNFISLGADEAIYEPPNLYVIGRKSDCRVIQINENYSKYDICCYSQSGYDWRLANASVANEGRAELWMIISPAGSSGDYVVVTRAAMLRDTSNFSYGSYRGQPLWLDASTSGAMATSAPSSSSDTQRIVAYVQPTGTTIWFEPSKYYVVVP